MPWLLVFIAYLSLLAAQRHWSMSQWRKGRLSARETAGTFAIVWALFPFAGLIAGAPWSAPLCLLLSMLLFTSVYWSLTRLLTERR